MHLYDNLILDRVDEATFLYYLLPRQGFCRCVLSGKIDDWTSKPDITVDLCYAVVLCCAFLLRADEVCKFGERGEERSRYNEDGERSITKVCLLASTEASSLIDV